MQANQWWELTRSWVRKPWLFLLAAGVIIVLVAGVFVVRVGAQSGGGAGGGGNGGGDTSGCSRPRWPCWGNERDRRNGWRIFDVRSDGPVGGFRDRSTTWSELKRTCSPYTNQVAVFVLYGGSGSWWHMSYNYKTDEGRAGRIPAGYYRGGTHISDAAALAAYNASRIDKTGLRWGDNVGWFCYGSKPQHQWTVDGQSYIKKGSRTAARRQGANAQTAKPGDRLYWDHDLRNNSSFNMNTNVTVNVDHAETVLEASPGSSGVIRPSPGPNGRSARGNARALFYRAYNIPLRNQNNRLVTQNDVGKRLCQRIAWHPGAWNNSNSWGSSAWACAVVPYNYGLMPTISVAGSSVNEGTKAVDGVAAAVIKNGSTKSKPANYAVLRFVVKGDESTGIPAGEGVTLGGNFSGNEWPCEVARQIGSRTGLRVDSKHCTGGGLPVKGDGMVFQSGTTALSITGGRNDITGLDLAVGDRLCYTTIVSAYSPSVGANVFRYAQPSCLNVAKKPKVQFWGGDVRTDGRVQTSATYKDPVYYGSWAEYAIFSGDGVVSASGASFSSGPAGRSGLTMAVPMTYNPLTFANTPQLGGFTTRASSVPQQFLQGGSSLGGSNVNPAELASGVYSRNGDVTIRAAELPAGRRVVIRASGRVVIEGNLTYTGATHQTTTALPQLVIVARDIVIAANVTEVSAWLIAVGDGMNGYISTCGAVASPAAYTDGLNAKTCDQALRITGPVTANRLYLRRTHGANADNPGLPAEIINLRPDTYLSLYGQTQGSGAIKTTYIRELPPRF